MIKKKGFLEMVMLKVIYQVSFICVTLFIDSGNSKANYSILGHKIISHQNNINMMSKVNYYDSTLGPYTLESSNFPRLGHVVVNAKGTDLQCVLS